MTTDVLIVGAGPAGLTAALVLARAGRDVLVLDGGPGRNAPATRSHNVFTREGAAPTELRRIGRAQAEGYSTRFLEQEAVYAEADEDGVHVRLSDGTEIETRRLLLATGVEDLLPELPGVAEAWGETVVHCPYCHGFELRGRPTAVLGAGEKGVQLSGFLFGWTDRVTLCCGPGGISGDERQQLGSIGVAVDERPVAALDVEGRIVRAVMFEDGSQIDATAVYIQPDQRPRGPLVDVLGLERTELGHVQVDEFMRTSAPGVSACGDVTTPMQAVQMAASSGFAAAASLNHDLVAQGCTYAG